MNNVIKNCRIIGDTTISDPTDIIIENGVISDIGNFGGIKGSINGRKIRLDTVLQPYSALIFTLK